VAESFLLGEGGSGQECPQNSYNTARDHQLPGENCRASGLLAIVIGSATGGVARQSIATIQMPPEKILGLVSPVLLSVRALAAMILETTKSSLGKKLLMAITGAGLFLFVIAHMMGNLQIFLGQAAINHYAHFLQSNPEVLWPARIGLLLFVGIHIWTSVSLTLENRAARGTPYEVKKVVDASLASRTMIWTGLLVAAYVVYHLLQFTLMTTNPSYRTLEYTTAEGARIHDVYRMMILNFSNLGIAVSYIIAMSLLCLHVSHGAGSMFQSLGLKNESYAGRIRCFASAASWILFLGYASVPLAIQMGWVK
jgi:succinate dehydrogenase / fumarate reductase cytochrome b subunit